jgi:hypothetical protein
VRHRQVIAVAAVAMFGLAGCSDRANNLETYYDDPTTQATPPSVAPAAPTTSLSAARHEPDVLAHTVAQAALTAVDLAGEGVSPAPRSPNATGCLASLPPGVPELARQANWQYPSGSSLKNQVVAYRDQEGAAVVATVRCAGQALNLPVAAGVEVQRAWCEGTTCAALVAKGHVVSGVQVTASTAARAADAAKRLAKILAAKLSAAQP